MRSIDWEDIIKWFLVCLTVVGIVGMFTGCNIKANTEKAGLMKIAIENGSTPLEAKCGVESDQSKACLLIAAGKKVTAE